MRRFLALGDSYTIGEGVAPEGRWPQQLVAALAAEGIAVGEPEVIATTGWTTDELAAGIDRGAPPSAPYDLVTLLIGVNNQYRGRSAEEYRGEFQALLARAIGFAGGRPGRVVVLSIPDWGLTPFAEGRDRAAIGREIARFNAINREEASRVGASWVDVTDSTPRAAGPEWLVADGLHPSALEYARWCERVLPVAREVLR